MKRLLPVALWTFVLCSIGLGQNNDDLRNAIAEDYESHLWPLFDHWHRNPELSLMETETAARLAKELRDAGFKVREGVGGTGVVGILDNGPGPMVMMRADMDGLPVEEKSGLANASTAQQRSPITGKMVHSGNLDQWSDPPRISIQQLKQGSYLILLFEKDSRSPLATKKLIIQ